MISENISLNLKACLSAESFSFDELIIETKNLFEVQGVPGFLRLLIDFTNKMVINDVKASESTSCCEDSYLIKNGNRSKNIYTSLGNIDFEWTTLRCKNCGKVYHPLKDFFELGKYQSVSNELELICMETVARESPCRSAQTLETHTESNFSFRSLHRWFLNTESDEIKTIHNNLNVLMADGTKFKKFVPQKKLYKHNQMLEKLGKPPIEISKRGEVKILMGIKSNNTLVPLGAWTSEAWKTIGKFIYKENNQNKRLQKRSLQTYLSLMER